MTDSLCISAGLREDLIALARLRAPHECAGVAIGPPGQIGQLQELRNAHADPQHAFALDTGDQLRAYRLADDRGWRVVAHFHSHLVGEAAPSPTDIAHAATTPNAAHVIVSLASDPPQVRAFDIGSGGVTEIPLRVVSA